MVKDFKTYNPIYRHIDQCPYCRSSHNYLKMAIIKTNYGRKTFSSNWPISLSDSLLNSTTDSSTGWYNLKAITKKIVFSTIFLDTNQVIDKARRVNSQTSTKFSFKYARNKRVHAHYDVKNSKLDVPQGSVWGPIPTDLLRSE